MLAFLRKKKEKEKNKENLVCLLVGDTFFDSQWLFNMYYKTI